MTDSYNFGPENIEVFSEAPIAWMGAGIHARNVVYVPIVIEDGRVGYCVHGLVEGQQEFIYLNPSTETDEGAPNVSVCQGTLNDPAIDGAAIAGDGGAYHYVVAHGFASTNADDCRK